VVSTTGLGKKRLTLIEFRTEEAELANFRSHPISQCQDQTNGVELGCLYGPNFQGLPRADGGPRGRGVGSFVREAAAQTHIGATSILPPCLIWHLTNVEAFPGRAGSHVVMLDTGKQCLTLKPAIVIEKPRVVSEGAVVLGPVPSALHST
jgi:hypothetical protein